MLSLFNIFRRVERFVSTGRKEIMTLAEDLKKIMPMQVPGGMLDERIEAKFDSRKVKLVLIVVKNQIQLKA